MAAGPQGGMTLAGSCKWTREAMDVRDYADLLAALARSGLSAPDPYLALFSLAGFTPRLRALAEAQDPPRLLLVELAEMYAV